MISRVCGEELVNNYTIFQTKPLMAKLANSDGSCTTRVLVKNFFFNKLFFTEN